MLNSHCGFWFDVSDCNYVYLRFAEELTRQRDALIDEIQNVKQREEQERETLRTVHQEELRQREIELKEKSDQDLRSGSINAQNAVC